MYQAAFSDEFKKQLRRLKKKDPAVYERLEKKIRDILIEPIHMKHLRNVLKGQQRVQVGPLVLRFRTEKGVVEFITLDHHDRAY